MGLAVGIAKRIAFSSILVVLAVIFVFTLSRLIPGDPITVLYGEMAADGTGNQLRKALGLDGPLYNQIAFYIVRVFSGNWGSSIYFHKSVFSIVLSRYLNSLVLTASSIAIAIIFCIVMGYIDFVLGKKNVAHIISLSSSIPTIIWGVAILALLAFLRIPMVYGHPIPPIVTLTVAGLGIMYRVFRDALSYAYSQPFIRMYTALGYGKTRAYVKALRFSLPIVLAVFLKRFGIIVTGAVAVEKIFSYPGMGQLFWLAFESRDYPLLIGWGLATAITFIAVYTIADLLHMILDPRVRSSHI